MHLSSLLIFSIISFMNKYIFKRIAIMCDDLNKNFKTSLNSKSRFKCS